MLSAQSDLDEIQGAGDYTFHSMWPVPGTTIWVTVIENETPGENTDNGLDTFLVDIQRSGTHLHHYASAATEPLAAHAARLIIGALMTGAAVPAMPDGAVHHGES